MADIPTVTKIFQFILEAKTLGHNFPLMIWGNQGVGKTAITRTYFEKNGYNVVVLNSALQSPEDLLGQIDGKGGYYRPKWMAPVDAKKPTVYFLDEFNRGQKYVLQCFFNFILEGKLHDHSIGPKDIVISASNPDTADFVVNSFDDRALISRFTHICLNLSCSSFVKYIKEKLDAKCVNVMEKVFEKTSSVFPNTNFELQFKVKPDARSLEKVAIMLSMLDKEKMEDYGFDLLAGTIGFEAAACVKEVFLQETAYSVKDILNFGHKSMDINTKKIEVVNSVNIDMTCTITNLIKDDPLNDDQVKHLINWISDIPQDSAVKLLSTLAKLDNFQNTLSEIIISNYEVFSNIIKTNE